MLSEGGEEKLQFHGSQWNVTVAAYCPEHPHPSASAPRPSSMSLSQGFACSYSNDRKVVGIIFACTWNKSAPVWAGTIINGQMLVLILSVVVRHVRVNSHAIPQSSQRECMP